MREKDIIAKILIFNNNELSSSDRELIEKAKEATRNSYAPYSKFHVGAAARLEDGTIVTGNNQENAAYPSGLCAERTTLFYANAQYPDLCVTELAVAAYNNDAFIQSPIPPCGACRQVILEVEERYKRPVRILLYGEKETYVVESIKTLLPLQFTGETMG